MVWLYKLPLSIIMEWLCFLAAMLLLRNVIPKFWRLFMVYLGVLVAIETYSYYLVNQFRGVSNHHIYNGLLLLYALFHLWMFYKMIQLSYMKWISVLFTLLLLAAYIVEWNFQGFGLFFYRTNTFFGVIAVLCCVLYYYSLFKQDVYADILKEPSFWFVTGCLIFYATSTGVNAFFAEIVRIKLKNQISIRFIMMTFLNIVMYGCWIKSFLCLRKQQNYILR